MLKGAEDELQPAEAERDALALRVPNPPQDDVPDGSAEEESAARCGGSRFDFNEPRHHLSRRGGDGAPWRGCRRFRAWGRRTRHASPSRSTGSRSTASPPRGSSRCCRLCSWAGGRAVEPARSRPTRTNVYEAPRGRPLPRRDRGDPGCEPPRGKRFSPQTSCRSATRPSRRASDARRAPPGATPAE